MQRLGSLLSLCPPGGTSKSASYQVTREEDTGRKRGRSPRAAPLLRVRLTQADKPAVKQFNRTDEEAVMRRIFVLALAALALLGVVTPDAFAQAPTPTFKINGLIDQVVSYSRNVSNYDGNLNVNDKQLYGRTRGRFDFIGEVGKAKGVLGIEMDMAYGQTGSNDSNIVTAGGAATTAVQA